ncbi:MAG: MarR family winged helix-turn-helix transcriptional regulator [Dethiobacteria bacterium]
MNYIEELTDELLLFYNGFASWESSVIRSSDLSVSEAHALEALGQHGTMNMKSLASKLGVATGTTTVTVDRLEAKNYARRTSTKKDRRVNLISLTEKGRKAFAEHHRFHLKLTEKMIACLKEEEVKQLLEIIKKINREIF